MSDEAKFCKNCGCKNTALSMTKSSAQIEAGGTINREALNQYLIDVRALECVRKDLNDKLEAKRKYADSLAVPSRFFKPSRNKVGFSIYGYAIVAFIAGAIINMFVKGLFETDFVFTLTIVIVAGMIVFDIARRIYYFVMHIKAIKDHKNAIAYDKERVKNEFEFKKNVNVEIRKINEELNNANNLLDKAYSANIIPRPFRNIYAVYYLCEYIITSHENLASALLNCNLDAIKQQLSIVIEQQTEMIVNQAIQISLNEDLIRQNSQKLNHLAEIERNTALAAQYTQIAAVNSETCAWMSKRLYNEYYYNSNIR